MAGKIQYSLGEEDLGRAASNLLYRGTPKNDTFHGKSGDDTISGANGNDKLYGDKGNDGVYGQNGNDKLFGEAGYDLLDGGTGNDKLKGGSEADSFIFSTKYDKDTILDFRLGDIITHDTVRLAGLNSVDDITDLREFHMTQVGKNVVIDGGGGDVLVLKGIDLDDLQDYHFTF
ncbi:MAG: calcium-binding protein [Rhizobium sp.]|nr:calcium-binding protein [Rhizobium sp.]MBX9455569.1 calcium-binding protein [Rhizobium sp.]